MLKLKEIEQITKGKIKNGEESKQIEKYYISKDNHYKDQFYIPIYWRGDRQQYILDAVKNGAMGYMISKSYINYDETVKQSLQLNPNLCIIEVEDINDAIYDLAMYVRNKNIDTPIIAVTGSVGKTSTTEMIYSILKQERKVYSDNGNNNTKPLLSWLMLDIESYDIAVLEVGIGNKDVMEPLSELLKPSICVINNIGTAHIEKLGSQENILKEKLKIINHIKGPKIVLLNNDDELLKKVELDKSHNVIKYSLNEVFNVRENDGKISFNINIYGKQTELILNAYGKHNILNAVCAIKIAEFYNISINNIKNGIEQYKSVGRRFEINTNKNKNIIIDDTYNASFDSMKVGLKEASKMKSKRKFAVLGEMLELGEFSKELHSRVGELFKELQFDYLYTQGENTKYICEEASKYIEKEKIKYFDSQKDLIRELLFDIKKEDLIYLKASNKMQFDTIVNKLKEV